MSRILQRNDEITTEHARESYNRQVHQNFQEFAPLDQ